MPRKDRPIKSAVKNPFKMNPMTRMPRHAKTPARMPSAAPHRPTIERPQYAGHTGPMTSIARTFVLVALLAAGAPALAADPVFPPGARVGLMPAEGLRMASDFSGFESADKKVKVGVAEIPAAAYEAVRAAERDGKPATTTGARPETFETAAGTAYLTSETGKDGAATVRMYSLIVSGGATFAGYVIAQVRDDADKAITDEAMRRMLASTALRPEVPVDEQLGLLPFKIGDLASFKTVRTLAPRTSILLTDGTEDTTLDGAPYMVIGLVGSAPASPDDRGRFAQQAAQSIPGLRSARITSSEPMRIEGSPGYETRIDAVTGKDDTPVSVVQWLRFGGNSTLRIIASATREDWPKAFPRFRAVRDGIDSR